MLDEIGEMLGYNWDVSYNEGNLFELGSLPLFELGSLPN